MTDGDSGPTATKPSVVERIVDRFGLRRIIGTALSVAAFLWFAVDNRREVTVDWWVADVRTRLIYVILVAFALGFVTSRFLARRAKRKG